MDELEFYNGQLTGEEIDNLPNRVNNENLLDNWCFVGGGSQQGNGQLPINQRGATTGSTTNGKIDIDRWIWSYGTAVGTWSLGIAGLTLTPASGATAMIRQVIAQLGAINGKTVTASVLFSDGTLYSGTVVKDNSTAQYFYNDSAVAIRSVNDDIRFIVATQKTIVGVKLELGSKQTLAHQENGAWVLNEIPNYEVELTKCQRFFLKLDNGAVVGWGVAKTATTALSSIPTPVSMRQVSPTILINGNVKLYHGSEMHSATPTITGFSGATIGANVVSATATVASGLTAGEACLIALRDSSAYITISCE